MHTLLTIFEVMAGLIVLLLLLALFMKREHYVRRAITIKAPRQKVFDFIKLLKNQDAFNKHAMAAPDRERTFIGTDGTVGFIYAWSGNKDAGEGEKEIIELTEGEKIAMEIRFVKPMKVSATIIMETEAISTDETKVYWSNGGTLNYPLNLFIPLMQQSVAKDMDSSLITLKNILEP